MIHELRADTFIARATPPLAEMYAVVLTPAPSSPTR